ncbi:hypothetical protein [Aquimarina sp. Aq78]|uniref:hypothetical protein n=1 Tax=Aquimarina sp. Aq78 TaxID=1191889 RepID=UPI000D0FE1C6|nr:hypothetical protein [Aquimarina sp. Aq78]
MNSLFKIYKSVVIVFFLLFASQIFANQPCWFKELLKDLAKPNVSQEFKTFFKNAPQENYDAYKILHYANKTKLRYNIDALSTVKRLRSSDEFVNFVQGLQIPNIKNIDDFLAKAATWYNKSSGGKGYVAVLKNMEDFVSTLSKSNIQCDNCVYLFNRFIVNDIPTGVNRQACYWLMEDVVANPNLVKNKKIIVEHPVTGLDGTTQRVDLKVGNSPGINLEYKWLSSNAPLGKDTFIREFVKRDMHSINSLDEVQWRIKWNTNQTNKLTKNQVVNWIENLDFQPTTNLNSAKDKMMRLFQSYGRKKDPSLTILDYDDLITFLKDNDDWFLKIFPNI